MKQLATLFCAAVLPATALAHPGHVHVTDHAHALPVELVVGAAAVAAAGLCGWTLRRLRGQQSK